VFSVTSVANEGKMDLKGKNVVVVGLARSGVAAANRLLDMGAKVFVTDSKESALLKDSLGQLSSGVNVETGGHSDATFANADLVVVSPGVPMRIPPLMKAKARGVDVISEVELAYRISSGKFIGITGTNGKSTTTELIGEMLKKRGGEVHVGGNIGIPLTDLVYQSSNQATFVVELSSFQLEGVETFKADVAVLLNITPDHLDRYPGMEEYAQAKSRISTARTASCSSIAGNRGSDRVR